MVLKSLQVGAGIRVPPNSSRLSLSWGVDFNLIRKEISLGNRFVDWKGEILTDCPFGDVEQDYGAPYYFIHRADFISILADAVSKKKNIILKMDSTVEHYDFDAPAVILASGERMHELIPGSTLDVVDGCGHLAPSECWRPVLKSTIDFLKSQPTTLGGRRIVRGE